MAGHLDLRDHFDSEEDLGISRGHRTQIGRREKLPYSLVMKGLEEISRSSADM
jgi:hypothetical protein